jgi:hypothetical protein
MLRAVRNADIPAIRFPDTEPSAAGVREFGSGLQQYPASIPLNDNHTSIELRDDAIRSFSKHRRELVCYFFDSMAQS